MFNRTNKMKIAILYICTGPYNQFFKEFYKSSENFFLKDIVEKEYFIWTDDLFLSKEQNVHIIEKQCEGFPKDSLFRFDMFLQKKEELKYFDYIYFFNSNAKLIRPVGKEILPDLDYAFLVGAQWPGKRKPFNHPMFFPYERRGKSTAYIEPKKSPYIYYMGGINGGRSKEYLEMIEILAYNIKVDYRQGIVAKVHDESHINRYFRDHKCKILANEYCWPEEWSCDFEPKIIFRDKMKLDRYFNKGRDNSLKGKLSKSIKIILHAIQWYI